MDGIEGNGLNYDLPQDLEAFGGIRNFTKCVVYVRPTGRWKEDSDGNNFGFDWMRVDDSEIRGDKRYATNMGKLWVRGNNLQPNANSAEGNFHVDAQMYRRKLSAYFRDSFNVSWKYRPVNGSDERVNIREEARFKYHVPVLNLMEGQRAYLQLIVEMADRRDLPESIEWRIPDPGLLSVAHGPNPLEPCRGKYECTVACNAPIKETQVVSFVAVYRNADGTAKEETCGFLRVLPNNRIKRLKVLLVATEFNNGNTIGTIERSEVNYAKKILQQGLVELDYAREDYIVPPGSNTEIHLNRHLSSGFFTRSHHASGIIFNGEGLYEYLRQKGLLEKYKDHIVVVAMGKECKQVSEDNSQRTNGTTSPPPGTISLFRADPAITYTPSASIITLFKGRNNETMIHEILHATGLLHSFSSDSPYVYKPKVTDNIMDYSHENNIPRIATWQWQWEAIRRYIDGGS